MMTDFHWDEWDEAKKNSKWPTQNTASLTKVGNPEGGKFTSNTF